MVSSSAQTQEKPILTTEDELGELERKATFILFVLGERKDGPSTLQSRIFYTKRLEIIETYDKGTGSDRGFLTIRHNGIRVLGNLYSSDKPTTYQYQRGPWQQDLDSLYEVAQFVQQRQKTRYSEPTKFFGIGSLIVHQ